MTAIPDDIKRQGELLKKRDELDEKARGFAIAEALDWFEFRDKEFSTTWLVEPLLVEGAVVTVASSPGVGKSMLFQELAGAIASGRPFLWQEVMERKRVLYLDLENPESEIWDRIFLTFGFEAAELDQYLFYCPIYECPQFDKEKAGLWWEAHLAVYDPQVVVVDTLGRTITGKENDADTFLAFYRHSILPLKQRGITLIMLDHLGKDTAKGGRGSSAKIDGPDYGFVMTKSGEKPDGTVMITLKAPKRRTGKVPEEIFITRTNGRHTLGEMTFTNGEIDLARRMDLLKVPLDASYREANALLKTGGKGARPESILKALKVRKLPNYKREAPKND